MKLILALMTLSFAFSAFAQRRTIDDLDTIGLNLDAPKTNAHEVHYPNYRMGGGNGAGRELRDCLMLDIRHSDAIVTLEQKLKLAHDLKVLTGISRGNDDQEKGLKVTSKGDKVVFLMPPQVLYMTFLQVLTRDGRDLNEVLLEHLPPVRAGNSITVPAGLVYVRDCRF